MTRYKPREWHQRQERRALAAPRSCTKCARSVCHGHCLRHCSRAARRCRSISRAHPMRAHMCVAAGRWQCTAAHRLWRLECPRQQCWSLTCVLGPQQTAAVAEPHRGGFTWVDEGMPAGWPGGVFLVILVWRCHEFILVLGIWKVYCWQIKTQSSHRITAGGKRRVAIPGVLVAGHPVQRGMDANLGSLDRVYEALAASRWWQRLWNQATEMVRGYGCSRGSRHAPTLHAPKGCARGRHSNPAPCWAPHSV